MRQDKWNKETIQKGCQCSNSDVTTAYFLNVHISFWN